MGGESERTLTCCRSHTHRVMKLNEHSSKARCHGKRQKRRDNSNTRISSIPYLIPTLRYCQIFTTACNTESVSYNLYVKTGTIYKLSRLFSKVTELGYHNVGRYVQVSPMDDEKSGKSRLGGTWTVKWVVDRTKDRSLERTLDRTNDRMMGRTMDRSLDRTLDQAMGRPIPVYRQPGSRADEHGQTQSNTRADTAMGTADTRGHGRTRRIPTDGHGRTTARPPADFSSLCPPTTATATATGPTAHGTLAFS